MAAPRPLPPTPPGLLDDEDPGKWERVKQALWETNLAAPIRGYYNLRNADPYTLYTDTGAAGQQAATDSFDAAGGVTAGSAMIPKPSNALAMGIKAYHSSPHDFDKFEWSPRTSMTGEGAQAYGAGLYFAESPKVSGRGGDYWRQFFNKMKSGPERTAAGAMFSNRFDPEEAIGVLERGTKYHFDRSIPGRYAEGPDVELGHSLLADESQQALEMLRSGKIVGPRTYEVNIDADPNTFLDWDKPLSEQSEAIKNAFRSINIADESVWPNITASDAYEMLRVDSMGDDAFLRDQAYRLARRSDAGAGASGMLRETGIPGIKFLDAGSRGMNPPQVKPNNGNYEVYWGNDPRPVNTFPTQAAADAAAREIDGRTRNYVVFDDSLIDIIKKYGIAGLLGAGGMYGMSADEAQAGAR